MKRLTPVRCLDNQKQNAAKKGRGRWRQSKYFLALADHVVTNRVAPPGICPGLIQNRPESCHRHLRPIKVIPQSVLHCASLLRTIFVSLACANERVHMQNIRNFAQARLDSEIKARFLLSEHGDLYFLLHNNSAHVILFNQKKI